MILLDSCILIAYFRENEVKHSAAVEIINNNDEIILSDYVLSEIYTVLMIREDLDIAKKAINWIISCPKINIIKIKENEIKNILLFIDNNKAKLSFVDISLLVISKNRWYKLISYDTELIKYSKI